MAFIPAANPKQFLALTNEHSTMLQQAVSRLNGLHAAAPVVICHEAHRFLVAEQLRLAGQPDARIVLESFGRDAAPAIALAALQATAGGQNGMLLILAADHLIADQREFRESVNNALPLAELGKLLSFGIVLETAETGCGYIQKGLALDNGGFWVERFVGKAGLRYGSKLPSIRGFSRELRHVSF